MSEHLPCRFCGNDNIKLLADTLAQILGAKSANCYCCKCGAQAPQKIWNQEDSLKTLLLEEQTIRQSYHGQLLEAKRRIEALEFTIEKHNEDIHYSCQCNQNAGNCDGNGCKDCAKDFLIGEISIFPQDAEIDIEPATESQPNCQSGRADICLAGSRDGVCCAENECDIDSGVRSA